MAQASIISDQIIFDQALEILRDVLQRDEERYLPNRHISLEEHEEAEDFLYNIKKIKDFDPTPIDDWGEPPLTADERHAEAFREKQVAKGRVSPLYLVK